MFFAPCFDVSKQGVLFCFVWELDSFTHYFFKGEVPMKTKNLSKLLALILALAMVFSLAACGGDKTDDTKKDDGRCGRQRSHRARAAGGAGSPGRAGAAGRDG